MWLHWCPCLDWHPMGTGSAPVQSLLCTIYVPRWCPQVPGGWELPMSLSVSCFWPFIGLHTLSYIHIFSLNTIHEGLQHWGYLLFMSNSPNKWLVWRTWCRLFDNVCLIFSISADRRIICSRSTVDESKPLQDQVHQTCVITGQARHTRCFMKFQASEPKFRANLKHLTLWAARCTTAYFLSQLLVLPVPKWVCLSSKSLRANQLALLRGCRKHGQYQSHKEV